MGTILLSYGLTATTTRGPASFFIVMPATVNGTNTPGAISL